MFKNKKVSNIVALSYYGAFLLAGIVFFLVGCGNMKAANESGLMGLFLGIVLLGLPLIPYLSGKVVKNKIFKSMLSIVGYVLLYAVLVLNIVYATTGIKGGASPYYTLGLSSTISTVVTLFLFFLRAEEEGSSNFDSKKSVGYDILNIVIYLVPFVSYLLAFLILLFCNLLLSFMIVGAFYLCMAAFIAVGAAHGGMIISIICNGILSLATVVCAIGFGVQPAQHGLDYVARPLDTLVFLPCLFALFFIPLTVSASKNDPQNDLYVVISRVASAVALPFLQYFIAVLWWGFDRLRRAFGRAVHCRLPGGHKKDRDTKERRERLGLAGSDINGELHRAIIRRISTSAIEVYVYTSERGDGKLGISVKLTYNSKTYWEHRARYASDAESGVKHYFDTHRTKYAGYSVSVENAAGRF